MPNPDNPTNDPLALLRSLWGSTGIPLPGLVAPTLDIDELDKNIADLKAVEGWLKLNLGMLQMSIQGLEMQRTALSAVRVASQTAQGEEAKSNPFMNPALWPWHLMPGMPPSPLSKDDDTPQAK